MILNPNNGLIYIADSHNYRIRVIYATTGIIHTIAGNGVSGSEGDGTPAVFSRFNVVEDMSINPLTGDVYLVDLNNRRIRKLSLIICPLGYYGPSCTLFNCDNLNECNSHGTCVSPQNCSCSSNWNSHNDCSVNDAGERALDIRTAGSIENGTNQSVLVSHLSLLILFFRIFYYVYFRWFWCVRLFR